MFLINGLKAAKERPWSKNYQKTMFLAFLILLCAGATWYFHFILRSEVVFSHLFYIPIGLAGLWWGRRGAWVGALSGALLLISHFLFALGLPILADAIRSVMFVVVGLTVGIVREWSLLAEKALRKAHDELEGRVEERTAELTTLNEELRKANRALRLLSRCNQAVIRATEESSSLHEICQLIVEAGGYRLAWVGFAEQDEAKTVRPAAQAGYEEGYLDTVNITWADTERGRGPTGTAIRTGTPSIARNVLADPHFAPWRAEATRRGYASSIALPLIANGLTIGALSIYAAEPDAFDAEEVKLLTELADDLVYGIVALRTRAERKRAEEELRKHREHLEELVEVRTAELAVAKERAEAADRVKSAFLATMSHELRTPLNSIIGFTGIMLQGLAGPLNDEQTKQLGMVRSSAHHLLNLINDVLDISKIEAGQLELASGPFDMRTTIQKVVQTVTPLAEKKGLASVVSVTPEVGQIVSDRRRVEQILINLLNNAVKFTEKGEVRIVCQVSDDRLVTSVVDTGVGIKPEDIDTLFEPFRQIDAGSARQHEGTGLGLSICKKLVGMLGGEIWAESEWGVGSTFTFTLPVKRRG